MPKYHHVLPTDPFSIRTSGDLQKEKMTLREFIPFSLCIQHESQTVHLYLQLRDSLVSNENYQGTGSEYYQKARHQMMQHRILYSN